MRILTLLSLFFFLLSCQSLPNSRPPTSDKNSSLIETKLTLETVLANWDQTLVKLDHRNPAAKSDWREDLHQLCLKQDNLCEFNVKSTKKRDQLSRKIITEINHDLEDSNFEALKNYQVDLGLKFFSRYKKNKLMDFADNLLRDVDCQVPDLKHALASTLEDELPDFEVKNAIQALYEKNSECPLSRTSTQSAYRAAMLRLIDQDCPKALPLLEKVTLSNEDYLKSRSLYWTWKCQSESPDIKSAASAQLPYFSYHRILIEESTKTISSDSSVLLEKTPVKTESSMNPNLNEAARLAEKLIGLEMLPAARAVLEKIRVDRVQETEPEFQVYWATLLHMTQAGIKKFQILSSLINNNPQFRSKTVQNMLFPTLYFDQVEANSKKLDPWLVQSLIRQESAFDPRARSRMGATGLMQLMPSTARRMAKMRGQLKDPAYNVQAGVKFLEILVNKFDGQVHLALAAYNAGPNKVLEWQKRYPTLDPMLFVDTIPYRETREYVAFILRNYHWYRSLNSNPEPAPPERKSSLARMATQIDSF